jgi:hypothetical protein
MKYKIIKFLLRTGILKRCLKLKCVQFQEYERGYSETNTVTMQYFAKYTYWFGFISIRDKIIEERIPSFAWMQKCTLGYTDWKSSIPSHLFKYGKN